MVSQEKAISITHDSLDEYLISMSYVPLHVASRSSVTYLHPVLWVYFQNVLNENLEQTEKISLYKFANIHTPKA